LRRRLGGRALDVGGKNGVTYEIVGDGIDSIGAAANEAEQR
jgi:hypothetical protein